ncbi:colony stimulating factor 3 (granulocyte) a [Spinachia spinachia]
MNILMVLAVPCLMAAFARAAPPPRSSAQPAEQRLQDGVRRSRSLMHKILISIPDAHASCVHAETLQLNSSQNAKLVVMASNIGIPSAPVLQVVSGSFSLDAALRNVSEGLQLHRALLSSVSPRLQNKDKVRGLLADIKDLIIQINKMVRMANAEAAVQPSPGPVALRLPGEYDVQVAAHLILGQLQRFGQDAARCLGSLDRSSEEEAES